jgi:hypothetical protein
MVTTRAHGACRHRCAWPVPSRHQQGTTNTATWPQVAGSVAGPRDQPEWIDPASGVGAEGPSPSLASGAAYSLPSSRAAFLTLRRCSSRLSTVGPDPTARLRG